MEIREGTAAGPVVHCDDQQVALPGNQGRRREGAERAAAAADAEALDLLEAAVLVDVDPDGGHIIDAAIGLELPGAALGRCEQRAPNGRVGVENTVDVAAGFCIDGGVGGEIDRVGQILMDLEGSAEQLLQTGGGGAEGQVVEALVKAIDQSGGRAGALDAAGHGQISRAVDLQLHIAQGDLAADGE